MSEIDRLRELGRLVEEQAGRRASMPAGLARRVRLRQAATSGVGAIVLVAGASLAWAGVRWIDRATFDQPADRRPIAGPLSPTPSGSGGIIADLEPVDADIGPSRLDPPPANEWRPLAEPAFLGGGRAFGVVWRMYACEVPIGFVGWHDIETASGKHIESGGATEVGSCRLVPQMAHLEDKGTSETRNWLLYYGYIAPEVSSVEVSIDGQRLAATILRVPESVGAPFDMYVLPVAGVPVTRQDEIALGTTIRDAGGDELDPGPLEHCLALSPATSRTVGLASQQERAATVAIAALTEAGLHDATGIYFDYGEVTEAEDGWTAYFWS